MTLAAICINGALAVVLHEAGHVGIALANGVSVKGVGISLKGVYIVREQGTPGANLGITLAGPLANIVVALLFRVAAPGFSQINLILGLSNLIPIPRSDGLRAVLVLRTILRERMESLSLRGQLT